MNSMKNASSSTRNGQRRGRGLVVLIGVIAVVAVAAWFALNTRPEVGDSSASMDATQLHEVTRSGFNIVIPASGELGTEQQLEIRNQLEVRALITEIVSEGSFVRKGEILLRLADDEILDKIKDSEDKVKTAESDVISAEQTLAIRQSTMASDIEKADLEIEIARLGMQAWEEGELLSKRQSQQLSIETAKINSERLQKRFEEAKSLVEDGHISNDEFDQDRIKMIEADAKVKEVELAQKVYEQYTIKQERAQKESSVEQSNAEKGRIRQRHLAEIVKIEADVESARFKLETARERLADLRTQLDACIIMAPSDGLVVYASSLSGERRGRGDEPPPQVGTELRQNELVIVLPDTSRMIASLKVGEALSGRVRPGQPVVVFSDSRPGDPVDGTVLGVSVLAEGGGWRDPNRRDYTVRVELDVEPDFGLKPSMRCRGEILLGRVDDAVNVPIQAIFRKGPLAFVYVPEEGGFAQKEVRIGRSSELLVEVQEGLEEGDSILLRRPSPGEIVSEIEMATALPRSTGRPSGRPSGRPGSAAQKEATKPGAGTAQAEKESENPPGRPTASTASSTPQTAG